MVRFGRQGARARGRLRRGAAAFAVALSGIVLTGAAAAPVPPRPALLSPACRVPEVYLTFPATLHRTQRLIDHSHPVRVLVVGRTLTPAVPLRHGRLERELERRLPGADFIVLDDRGAVGLAADVFGRIQTEVFEAAPDLVIWEVGASDAIAAADPEELGETIRDAAHWLRARNIDLVLVDPPFVPGLAYEHIYWPIVGEIGAVSDRVGINLLRWYAVLQYWDIRNRHGEHRQALLAGKRPCMPEILAEAIARAAGR